MNIVRATVNDIPQIENLLYQVHEVHANGRPDLFKHNEKKYTSTQIKELLKSEETPIYVYKKDGVVLGYAFVIYMVPTAPSHIKLKTMYIDDLCVEINQKHSGICSIIFKDLEEIAKQQGCYNIILNVYNFNTPAYNFYKKQGMSELKTYMEKIVK